MDLIEVYNARRVSNALGFEVKHYENLLENPKCEDFIKKYKKYFESTNKKDFIEFYNKTGIMISHVYKGKYSKKYKYEEIEYVCFDQLGCSMEKERKKYPKRFNNHLLVLTKVESLTFENNKIYADGKLIYDIDKEGKSKDLLKTIDLLNSEFDNIKDEYGSYEDPLRCSLGEEVLYRQKETLSYYNYLDYDLDTSDAEQLVLSPFGDIFVLKEDGTLLRNNEEYDKNVEYIWEQDEVTKFIIFEDSTIEFISSSFGNPVDIKTDQLYYNRDFLAYLKNKIMYIIIKDDDNNASTRTEIKGIDKFDFDTYEEELILYKNNEEIRFPILNSFIEIHNKDIY